MTNLRLTAPIGGLAGILAAALFTWLFDVGSRTLRVGFGLGDAAQLAGGGWLLVLAGALVGVVLWAGHLHPLVVGVPALWSIVRFGPILLGSDFPFGWSPEWLGRFTLTQTNEAAFVVTGLLMGATAWSVWLRQSIATSETDPTSVE